jgi:hypothetical protein
MHHFRGGLAMNDKPESNDQGQSGADDPINIIIYDDSPGDRTIRPMRSGILRQFRPDQPPKQPDSPETS